VPSGILRTGDLHNLISISVDTSSSNVNATEESGASRQGTFRKNSPEVVRERAGCATGTLTRSESPYENVTSNLSSVTSDSL